MLPNKIDLLSAGGSHIYTPTIFPCFHVLAHRSPFPVLLVPHLHESKLSSTDSLPMKILFPTITGPLDPSTGSTHPHSDQTLHTSLWLFFFFFFNVFDFSLLWPLQSMGTQSLSVLPVYFILFMNEFFAFPCLRPENKRTESGNRKHWLHSYLGKGKGITNPYPVIPFSST